jgi:hypothetical protein
LRELPKTGVTYAGRKASQIPDFTPYSPAGLGIAAALGG